MQYQSIIHHIPPWKLTWQWEIHPFKMYFLLNMGIFQGTHIRFQGYTIPQFPLPLRSIRSISLISPKRWKKDMPKRTNSKWSPRGSPIPPSRACKTLLKKNNSNRQMLWATKKVTNKTKEKWGKPMKTPNSCEDGRISLYTNLGVSDLKVSRQNITVNSKHKNTLIFSKSIPKAQKDIQST